MLYDIDVHIFFPPTMFTPGYDEENKTKPQITKDIESTDDGITANAAAKALLQGKQIMNLMHILIRTWNE
jgi:3-dehydrosphinganine reductase